VFSPAKQKIENRLTVLKTLDRIVKPCALQILFNQPGVPQIVIRNENCHFFGHAINRNSDSKLPSTLEQTAFGKLRK
jgi:hypothetical protein